MTPEHTALVARLDEEIDADIIAALREQAGEIERLKGESVLVGPYIAKRIWQERDTLRAEVAALRKALEAARISHNYCEDGWYSCPLSDERLHR